MSDKKEDLKEKSDKSLKNAEEKPHFGSLKPLTAIQIISLLAASSTTYGGGPCY